MGVAPGETVLIKVARFWPEKRHDILLQAFQSLLRRTTRVQLWIPGVGPEEPRVRAIAADLGVSDRCRFLGFRTDLPELLAMADDVRSYVTNTKFQGYQLSYWDDRSVDVKDRMQMLVRNGLQGLALVFILLAIFLDLRLAFWVALGIPVSVFGAGAFGGGPAGSSLARNRSRFQ